MLRGALDHLPPHDSNKEFEDLENYPRVRSVQGAFDVIEGPPLLESMEDEPSSNNAQQRVPKFEIKIGTDDDMSDPRKEIPDPEKNLDNIKSEELSKESSTIDGVPDETSNLSEAQKKDTTTEREGHIDDVKVTSLSDVNVHKLDNAIHEINWSEVNNTIPLEQSFSKPLDEIDVTTQKGAGKDNDMEDISTTRPWKDVASDNVSNKISMEVPKKKSADLSAEVSIFSGGIPQTSTEVYANTTITQDFMTRNETTTEKSLDSVPRLWNIQSDPVNSLNSVEKEERSRL
jgi:hypothetical protein